MERPRGASDHYGKLIMGRRQHPAMVQREDWRNTPFASEFAGKHRLRRTSRRESNNTPQKRCEIDEKHKLLCVSVMLRRRKGREFASGRAG